jgi:hypothetical protein
VYSYLVPEPNPLVGILGTPLVILRFDIRRVGMSDQSPTESNSSPVTASGSAQPDVVITAEHVNRLFSSPDPVTTHVAVDGLKRAKLSTLRGGIDHVARAETVYAAAQRADATAARWRRTGLFRDVAWNLEPLAVDEHALQAAGGRDRNLVVRFDVDEQRAKWDIGVMTSLTGVPEVNFSAKNIAGYPYSLSLGYLPSTSTIPSGELRLTSLFPALGDRCDYVIGRRIETRLTSNRPCPIADNEVVTEAKVVMSTDDSQLASSTLTVGLQDRSLAVRDLKDQPDALAKDYRSDTKLFARWSWRLANVGYHADPRLQSRYGLPVAGYAITNRLEAFSSNALTTSASTAATAPNLFLKHEFQLAKFFRLLPEVVLDLNVTCGSVFNVKSFVEFAQGSRGTPTPAASAIGAWTDLDVPLADRLYASGRQVRNYRAIGPSNVDYHAAVAEAAARDPSVLPHKAPKFFRSVGGDAMWAASAVLNFPFLLYPNEFIGNHLFANVGHVHRFGSVANAVANWRDLFRADGVVASVGGGVVLTKLPGMFSTLGAGRFEVNWAMPFALRDKTWTLGNTTTGPTLFQQIKWGLHWTNLEM